MIAFEEAYQKVLECARHFGTEEIPLHKSTGRILMEDWHADRDFPPFDRVMMDGIAIKHNEKMDCNFTFDVEGIAAAGDPQMTLQNPNNCIEVMTGASLPNHTDTVIRYEDVLWHNGKASLKTDILKGQNVHIKGKDRKEGELLLTKGRKISAADIGVGATIGKSMVKVSSLPKTLIVSTGNELVKVTEKPLSHQIRMSNVFQMAAALNDEWKIETEQLHITDNQEVIKKQLAMQIQNKDLIILSGGVSKGKFDFIPEALTALGVKKHFHRVKQRPGKPFWFGIHPNGCTIFAMPGNPISSFMCTQVYLISWLKKSLGIISTSIPKAKLAEDVNFKPDLTYFLEVQLAVNHNAEIMAIPQKGNGSGDLANLSKANAFLQLPQGQSAYKKGEIYPYHQYASF